MFSASTDTSPLHRAGFAPRYGFGAVVYLKVRAEKVAGMVTGYFVRPQGWGYYVGWADGREGVHYEFELTAEFAPEWAARMDEEG